MRLHNYENLRNLNREGPRTENAPRRSQLTFYVNVNDALCPRGLITHRGFPGDFAGVTVRRDPHVGTGGRYRYGYHLDSLHESLRRAITVQRYFITANKRSRAQLFGACLFGK